MRDPSRDSRLGSFLLGGIVGGLAAVAASHLRHRPRRARPLVNPGLAAFEEAPCFQELLEREQEPWEQTRTEG